MARARRPRGRELARRSSEPAERRDESERGARSGRAASDQRIWHGELARGARRWVDALEKIEALPAWKKRREERAGGRLGSSHRHGKGGRKEGKGNKMQQTQAAWGLGRGIWLWAGTRGAVAAKRRARPSMADEPRESAHAATRRPEHHVVVKQRVRGPPAPAPSRKPSAPFRPCRRRVARRAGGSVASVVVLYLHNTLSAIRGGRWPVAGGRWPLGRANRQQRDRVCGRDMHGRARKHGAAAAKRQLLHSAAFDRAPVWNAVGVAFTLAIETKPRPA